MNHRRDNLVCEEKKKRKNERTMEIIIQCQVCSGSWQHDIYLGGLFSLNYNLRSPSGKLKFRKPMALIVVICKCKLSKYKVDPKSETAGEYKSPK